MSGRIWKRLFRRFSGLFGAHPQTSKIVVRNSRANPQRVAVEPWANDYTLLPGEELVVIAFGDSAVPRFHVVEWDGTTQIYCEESSDFKVMQGDVELECGHNRQPEVSPTS
jgi:hypothetical protein